jgi:N-methylhydantoinase B
MVHGDTLEVPVELQEANHPYLLEWVRLRQDSGGAGKFRGGLGVEKCYRMLADAELTVIMERTKCPPWGLDGGQEGLTGRVEVWRAAGGTPETYRKGSTRLKSGDRVKLFSGGGGGFGSPAERPVARIAQDVRQGYISKEAAARDYGFREEQPVRAEEAMAK